MQKLISSFYRLTASGALATLLALGGQTAAHAATDGSFTPAQRAEIVSIVRNALKTDPTILTDAVAAMQSKASEQKATSALDVVRHNKAQFGNSTSDIVLGNPHGKLSIVEFYDPRCPYCRKVLPDLDALVAAEPDLKLVEKVIPVLGPNSVLDSQAIVAAGLQNAYKPFQQALMADTSAPGMERIRHAAALAGLDADRLVKDMKSPAVATALAQNVALARSIDLDGTPTFIIGEQQIIPGAVSLDDLKAAVEKLKQAH
ncbi:thioredoxin domain-containing protein [Acetobacter fabarum]|jgi:protein-disulfide isomerase|uniref:DsbA family protein n=1 Tax=Acetobacter TaxID=434 RepID=UPI000A3CBEB5|nr:MULTISPECIES: DsbA family protein [Acetobacter]MDN6714695.1 DsbA family protein [Acetobacter sp.]MCI1243958.1 DsbA family protein [Acetobacter fabarum]MCI1909806.1 DsbA family protein [Acetobacter fabarum]MCI1928412.1 DsbA family protein [Acetobacter fabarum]MCI1948326.1 DsbA family protein [Acetobacter fabarum]